MVKWVCTYEFVDFKYLYHSVYISMGFHDLCMDYHTRSLVRFIFITLSRVAMSFHATPGESFPRFGVAFYGVLLGVDQGQRSRLL